MLERAIAVQGVILCHQKMESVYSLELLTRKKERPLLLVKQNEDDLLVYERGFVVEEIHEKFSKLRKLLRTLLKNPCPLHLLPGHKVFRLLIALIPNSLWYAIS